MCATTPADAIRLADEAFNRGDLDVFFSFYEPDARIQFEVGQPPITVPELRARFEPFMRWKLVATQERMHIIECGDVALTTSRWRVTGVGPNGTSGAAGYRTDDYLYLPVGITSRTKVASRSALSFTLEADALLHGWQKTRDSELGGGDIPATPTAPPFTIDSFSDVSFSQSKGWALRASAKYQVTPHWSVEPYYLHWSVSASPLSYETAVYGQPRRCA